MIKHINIDHIYALKKYFTGIWIYSKNKNKIIITWLNIGAHNSHIHNITDFILWEASTTPKYKYKFSIYKYICRCFKYKRSEH